MTNKTRDYANSRVLVLGLGKSGTAAAKALARLGAEVSVTDSNDAATGGLTTELIDAGVKNIAWKTNGSMARGYDLVVVSPGVAIDSPAVKVAKRSRAEVIGELELAYRLTAHPIIAVTGTNGKSTVVTLLGEIFSAAGIPNVVAGNIGLPMVEAIQGLDPRAVIIAEVSSFQLETVIEFKPKIGILLNITPDHLDRHRTMFAYRDVKTRLFAQQTEDDYAVINLDDELAADVMDDVPSTVVPYSIYKATDRGVFVDSGRIWAVLPPRYMPVVDGVVAELGLRGAHNLENILAAVAAALLWGISAAQVTEAVQAFKGLSHRVERVAAIGGVTYYDDSKATNPDAARRAIEAFNEPVVLLAGGRNKGMDFSLLEPIMKERVKAVVAFGEAAEEIAAVVAEAGHSLGIELVRAATMHEAVTAAHSLARPGDIVLLSPGCASFDMYTGYAARGDDFQAEVRKLTGSGEKTSDNG